jgi:hypothetical protein
VTWVGSVPPVGKTIRCKRLVAGAQVTCVEAMRVYEIGTYVCNGVLCIYMLSQSDFDVGVYPVCAEMRVH